MSDTALIFPGQGSQSVGMLSALAERYPEIRETFEEASSAVDRDLWALASSGPEEELNQTRWTQPVVLAGDIAIWRVLRSNGMPDPIGAAGHSLGEYAALVSSGAMAFDDAVRIVHLRGELMQQAVAEGEGAMAAILGLAEAEIERICAESAQDGRTVVAANYNAPGQLVIAGHRDAVEAAAGACREAGAKRALLLPVSVPSHSPLMAPAADPLMEALEAVEFGSPSWTVLHNSDCRPRSDAAGIRRALVDQLTRPVRWTDTLEALASRGANRYLECGPGKVLTGLGKRFDRSADWIALDDPDTLAAERDRAQA